MKYLLILMVCVLSFTACGYEPVVYEVDIEVSEIYGRCVEFITAFLNHDTDKIEELTFSEKGMFKDYEKLTFGEYEVLHDPDDGKYGTRLYFNFEITKSGLDTFPEGKYETFVEDGFHGTVFIVLNKDGPNKFAPIDNWFKTCSSYLINSDSITEMDDIMRSDISETLLSLLPESNEGYTLDEIQSAAELYYGIENFIPGGVVGDFQNEGKYIVAGHGGDIWKYDITEVTDTTVTLQFYADYMRTIKSHLIMYTLNEVNGQFVIKDCEIFEQSKYEPYHRRA